MTFVGGLEAEEIIINGKKLSVPLKKKKASKSPSVGVNKLVSMASVLGEHYTREKEAPCQQEANP